MLSYLHEDHRRNLLGREDFGLFQILYLHHRVSALVDNLERPCLNVLFHRRIIKPSPDKSPGQVSSIIGLRIGPCNSVQRTYLISNIVFAGFIAAWFLAASPINRSSSVKETNEGVVKLPCSLATAVENQYRNAFKMLT